MHGRFFVFVVVVAFSFFKLGEKCYRKATRKKRTRFFNFTISKFREQRYGELLPTICNKRRKAVKRNGEQFWHGVRRLCKLYTKGRPAGKLTWYECHRDHLEYRWRDNTQRSPLPLPKQNKNKTKTKTKKTILDELRQLPTLRLEKMWNKTLWKLLYSAPHRLENVRKHINENILVSNISVIQL